MTLGTLKQHIKELEERGATDDSEVYTFDGCDFCHVQDIDYDPNDNSVNIYPE